MAFSFSKNRVSLPNSAIHTSVRNLAESLREELVPKTAIERAAIGDTNVQKFVAGQLIKRVIVVPGKLVNVVV